MSFTVVPLHNVSLGDGTRIPFGNDLVFQDTPAWVKEDKSFLKYLSEHDKQSVLVSQHAFVAEYEAGAIGEPDPEHAVKKGERQRSIQESKTRMAILGNLAIWLRQPSRVCFTVSLHACMWPIPGQTAKQPILQQSEVSEPLQHQTWERSKPVYCHTNDVDNPITAQHIVNAAEFSRIISRTAFHPRKHSCLGRAQGDLGRSYIVCCRHTIPLVLDSARGLVWPRR
jgi:hypothetical protein